jgi:ATP-dependent 26S proteasome regulatory subunit
MTTPYATTHEYVSEYFALLALRLHRQVVLTRMLRNQGQNEAFLGLFLSEEEINRILTELHGVTLARNAAIVNLETEELTLATHISARLACTSHLLRPGQLAALFNLSAEAVEVLLLLLAVEVDNRFARVYAYLQDDVARRWLSPGLALRLLPGALPDHPTLRSLFTSASPLLQHRLMHLGNVRESTSTPLLDRPLKLDDRIVEYLLEHDPLDSALSGLVHVEDSAGALDTLWLEATVCTQLHHLIALWRDAQAPPVLFWGRAGSGKAAGAAAVARALQRPLVTLNGTALALQTPENIPDILQCARREARLRYGILYVRRVDALDERAYTALTHMLQPGMILSSRTELHAHELVRPPLTIHFLTPDYALRQRLWNSALHDQAHFNGTLPAELAARFLLTPGQITQAVHAAQQRAWLHSGPDAVPNRLDLFEGCRQQSNPGLARLAKKVVTPYGWDDLVLPETQITLIQAIESQVQHSQVVYEQWGFGAKLALGKGLNALFSGPPGTGKTMAAGILAQSLGLDLYKIDLSSVVSKYIGETEKNLQQIFDEASTANVILFFDEADALFGKRSEVKDAHDRYANIEISYLLQKMEEYEGVAILATNLSQNMDEAFARRMQFVVDFPFPTPADRERLWRGMLPTAAPRIEDIDFPFLAAQFELSGGNIKNCVVAAAFLAAEEGMPIGMPHLLQGVVRELGKLGRPITRANFADYYTMVRRKRV